MLTGLDALFLEVNNLEESVSFYHDRLGCEIESHNPEAEPPLATLRAGGVMKSGPTGSVIVTARMRSTSALAAASSDQPLTSSTGCSWPG